MKKKQEEKTVSLNEAQRLAEKKEIEARNDERKQERATRPASELKTTEITLGSLDGKTNVVAAVTKKVLEDAAKNEKPPTGKDHGKEKDKDEKPVPDPYFDEGLNILSDYIQLLGTMHAQN